MEQQSPNERRLEDWMRTYGTAILRTCFVILSDAREAEDAMQDTFLRAWRAMDTFEQRNGASVKTWLMRIAINVCRDYQRKRWFRHIDMRHALEDLPQGMMTVLPEDRELIDAGHPALARRPQKAADSLLLSGHEPSGNRRCTGHQQVDGAYAAQKSGTGAQTFADRR